MAQYGAPTSPFACYAQKQGWVLGQSGGFTWLKADSGATQFLASMLTDVVRDYPGCRGVQLDDHFGQPKELLRSTLSSAPRNAPSSSSDSSSRLVEDQDSVVMTAAAHIVSNAVRNAMAGAARKTVSPALRRFGRAWSRA